MNASRTTSALLGAALLLALAQPAWADSIAPTAYFWPGVLPLTLGLALPASVLAAVLERPFVSRAGVREYALWYSLQANLLSLVIGYLTLPVGIPALFTIGPLWSLIAVTLSVVSEGWYYQRWVIRDAGRLRWRWVIWGNLFSSVVLLLLPYVALEIKLAKPALVVVLDPYQGALFWGSVAASVLVFALSFLLPPGLRWGKALANRPLQTTGTTAPVSPEFKAVEADPAAEF
jgi:hypothetical protein